MKRAVLQLSTQILGMLCKLGEFRMPCQLHPHLAPSLHAPPVLPDKREATVLFSAECSVPAYAYLLRLGMLQQSPALPCVAVVCVSGPLQLCHTAGVLLQHPLQNWHGSGHLMQGNMPALLLQCVHTALP